MNLPIGVWAAQTFLALSAALLVPAVQKIKRPETPAGISGRHFEFILAT
jgi:hypothetical protein